MAVMLFFLVPSKLFEKNLTFFTKISELYTNWCHCLLLAADRLLLKTVSSEHSLYKVVWDILGYVIKKSLQF